MQTGKSIIISVHSFVDLITNSSSETYVTATEKSVETLKALVDSLLPAGKTCDDVLDIEFIPAEDEFNTAKIKATAIDPNCAEAAALINKLGDTFETTEVCC